MNKNTIWNVWNYRNTSKKYLTVRMRSIDWSNRKKLIHLKLLNMDSKVKNMRVCWIKLVTRLIVWIPLSRIRSNIWKLGKEDIRHFRKIMIRLRGILIVYRWKSMAKRKRLSGLLKLWSWRVGNLISLKKIGSKKSELSRKNYRKLRHKDKNLLLLKEKNRWKERIKE